MAEKYKVFIRPKNGDPFMLFVGAMSSKDNKNDSDAFGVFAVNVEEGLVRKMCVISEPRPLLNDAGLDLAAIAERHRRAGAKLGDNYDAQRYAHFKVLKREALDDRVARALRDDWSDGCRDLDDGGTYGDIIATAFTRIADALRVGGT